MQGSGADGRIVSRDVLASQPAVATPMAPPPPGASFTDIELSSMRKVGEVTSFWSIFYQWFSYTDHSEETPGVQAEYSTLLSGSRHQHHQSSQVKFWLQTPWTTLVPSSSCQWPPLGQSVSQLTRLLSEVDYVLYIAFYHYAACIMYIILTS